MAVPMVTDDVGLPLMSTDDVRWLLMSTDDLTNATLTR